MEKYKATTDYRPKSTKKEINDNKLNLNNGIFKAFNDFNSLECNNNYNINLNKTKLDISKKKHWVPL